MKILGKYAWLLFLVMGVWSCTTDDEQEIPEPDLSTAAAIDLIEQASIAIGADNANWNGIVRDLESELENGGQFGFFGQVTGHRAYAEAGVSSGVDCIAAAMPNWIRGELSDIVKEFRGISVDDPLVVLCSSNLEDDVITETQFNDLNKIIVVQGYNLVGEFQMVVNLENDTDGTSDKVSTSFVDLLSDFELAVNLLIYDYPGLQAYEYLRVYFQGEVIIELPIQ